MRARSSRQRRMHRCSLRLLLEGAGLDEDACAIVIEGLERRRLRGQSSPADRSARSRSNARSAVTAPRHPIRCDATDFHRKCARCTGSSLK